MDFTLNERERHFQGKVREFMAAEVRPGHRSKRSKR